MQVDGNDRPGKGSRPLTPSGCSLIEPGWSGAGRPSVRHGRPLLVAVRHLKWPLPESGQTRGALGKPELTSLGRSHHGVTYGYRGTGLILNGKIVSAEIADCEGARPVSGPGMSRFVAGDQQRESEERERTWTVPHPGKPMAWT
jgi:hypothetical protein